MALPGELSGLNGVTCDCGEELPLKVCMSAAGYYLGYFCNYCGPWSRETGYYAAREAAEEDLKQMAEDETPPEALRDTEFHPGPLTVEEGEVSP